MNVTLGGIRLGVIMLKIINVCIKAFLFRLKYFFIYGL